MIGEGFKDSAARKWYAFLLTRLRKVDPLKGRTYKEHRKLWGMKDMLIIVILVIVSQGYVSQKNFSEWNLFSYTRWFSRHLSQYKNEIIHKQEVDMRKMQMTINMYKGYHPTNNKKKYMLKLEAIFTHIDKIYI